MTRSRSFIIVAAATIAALSICWLFWRSRSNVSTPAPSSSSSSGATFGPNRADHTPSADDLSPTLVDAHNLLLRKGPNFRIYIRWIRGQLVRTRRQINPSFDDPESFVLQIQNGVIHINIGDISNYLNVSSPPDAPLKNISLQPEGNQLKLRGTIHKIISLPIEIVGTLAPTRDGRVQFHVTKLNFLKVPLKGLLGGFHVELSDLVHKSKIPGIQIVDNDIIFDTQRLFPPPHIHGQLTVLRISPPDIEVIYGNTSADESRLAQWHNFLRLSGGTLDFGKLTMHHVDLTMIDASQDPWFDLDLVNYKAQLVNGYTRMTDKDGLEIFMPDVDEQFPKKSSPSITGEWLKDRTRSLPDDVPVK